MDYYMKQLLLFFLTLTTINQVVLPNERSSLRLLSELGLVLGSILIFRTYTGYGSSSLSQFFKGELPLDFPSLTPKELESIKEIHRKYTDKETRVFDRSKLSPSEQELDNLYDNDYVKAKNNYGSALAGYAGAATLLGLGVGGLLTCALYTPSTGISKD